MNDYEPSANLMALLSRKSMVERVTGELSEAMAEDEVRQPSKVKAKQGKASKRSKGRSAEDQAAMQEEAVESDDDGIEIEDADGGEDHQAAEDADDDDDIEIDDGNRPDSSSSEGESQSDDDDDGTDSRKKKGRTREKRILQLQKVGKKKGKKFKSRDQKISDAMTKPVLTNGKPIIVQHPIGYPIEQMKELTSLLKASIEMCKDRQSTQETTSTRDEVAVQITRAVQSVCSKAMKNKIFDWAKSKCEPDMVALIKERLGLFSKVKKLSREELRKLQHKQEDERKVGLLEENYNSERSEEESVANSEDNDTMPEHRSHTSGSVDQSRGLHYNKVLKAVGLPISTTIYDNHLEKQSHDRLKKIDKLLEDQVDIDESVYTLPRAGSQQENSKNDTRKASASDTVELSKAIEVESGDDKRPQMDIEIDQSTDAQMNVEHDTHSKDADRNLRKSPKKKPYLINEINPEPMPMVSEPLSRHPGAQEYPPPVETPFVSLHQLSSSNQVDALQVNRESPADLLADVNQQSSKQTGRQLDDQRLKFDQKYPTFVKAKKDAATDVAKEKNLLGEILADNLKEERRLQREKKAREEKERLKLMKKTTVPHISNGDHHEDAQFSDDSDVSGPKRGGFSDDDDDSFNDRCDSKPAKHRSRSRSKSKSPKKSPLKYSAEKAEQKTNMTLQLEQLVDQEDNKFRNISLMMSKSMEDQEDNQMHLPLNASTYSGDMDHHPYSQDNLF